MHGMGGGGDVGHGLGRKGTGSAKTVGGREKGYGAEKEGSAGGFKGKHVICDPGVLQKEI